MDSVPASRNYQGGFATKLMLKDLGLAEAAAQHCSASVPMSAQAAKLYQQVTHAVAMLQTVHLLYVQSCCRQLTVVQRCAVLLQVMDAGGSELDFGAIYQQLYCQPAQRS